MKSLPLFGMPISLEEESGKLLSLDSEICWEDYSRKYSDKMFGLLAEKDYQKTNEPYYDFYKAIVSKKTRNTFSEANLRYDSTVILPGVVGKEFKKTAGHFHLPIPGESYSFPELYQVINGKALFVMQRVDNYKKETSMTIEDMILAEVRAGETIIVPPNYGHCTVNLSKEPLVFINLVSINSINYYDSVKQSHGMGVYVFETNDGYRLEKNPNYKFKCIPKIVTPIENLKLGIQKNIPIYTKFLDSSNLFTYLNTPKDLEVEFFKVLKEK